MSTTKSVGLAMVALLTAACGGVPVATGADIEPGYDLRRYASYVWAVSDEAPLDDTRLDDHPLLAQRLHAAIHWELASRGIEYGGRGPALAVHYHATLRNRQEIAEADRGAGYATEYAPAYRVVEYQEGTFFVDIADARTREIIWRGWARLDLGNGLEHPSIMREDIDEAIGRMFESFPIDYESLDLPLGR
jgi:hypothetical protein